MTHEEKETPGAATPGATVNIDGGPGYNKEQVLHLIETLKVENSLLQKRHLQRHRRNGFLRKLRVLRDRFLNRNSTDRKPLNKRRKFRH
nr:MAG TPA: hypothetical protein [Caudoviricetes sp.]DAX90525.1 MAG TPA: hypothetical protein [Caudoviricetes sp.]